MRQQVFLPSGKIVFDEHDPLVLYSAATLRSMAAAGYTVLVDGKRLKQRRNLNAIKEE